MGLLQANLDIHGTYTRPLLDEEVDDGLEDLVEEGDLVPDFEEEGADGDEEASAGDDD